MARWNVLAANASTITSVEEQCRLGMAVADWDRILTTLMTAYGNELHRYTWALLRNRQAAEDVVQNVFIQAYEGLAKFEGRSTFRTWLYGIARHRCLDEIARRRRWARVTDHETSLEELPESAPLVERNGELRSTAVGLETCLDGLNPEVRAIVLLRYRQDLSYDEIGSLTGATVGSLRVRVCRALAAIKRCLDRKETRV